MFTMFPRRAHAAVFLEASIDITLGLVAVLIAALTINSVPPAELLHTLATPGLVLTALGFAVCMSLLQSFLGLYRGSDLSVASQLGRLLIAISLGGYITYLALKETGFDVHASRLVGHSMLNLVIALILVRGAIAVARKARRPHRVLIIGTGPEADSVAKDLRSHRARRHEVVGFYPTSAASPDSATQSAQLVDTRTPLDQLVRDLDVQEIVIAAREQRGGVIPMDQLVLCRSLGIPVIDLAGLYERNHAEVSLESLKASWLVYGSGFVQGRVRRVLKRAFDIVISSVLLLLTSPIMAVAAVCIAFDSRGPLLYRQERVGLGGRPFMCLKFRSMRTDAERDGVARWATKSDPRVTRVGRFLRKTRIDELPQLFSVLKGEMSIVGPRPERPSFVRELKEQVSFYDLRHTLKPGITGWAQVRFCYGASVEDARRKHQFDLYYVKNNSLLLDIVILLETVSVVLLGEGQ